MKKILLAVAVLSTLSACTVVDTEPGHEAVVMDKPYVFGTGGLRADTYKPGRYYTWLSAHTIPVDVTPQRIDEAFDDLMTSDSIPVDFHTAIQIRVIDPVVLIAKYGDIKKIYVTMIQRQYQNLVRDEAKNFTMTDLLSKPETSTKMEANIRPKLDKLLKEEKLPVVITDISIGRASPNQNVKNQIDATAEQQQRSKTMKEAQHAETERKAAEEARAAADNAYRQKMDLSPDQFLQLESIKRYSEACKQSSCNLIFGSNGAPVLLQQAKK